MAGESQEHEDGVEEFEVDEYVLTDDEGNAVHFAVLLEFEVEDVTYRAMCPIEQLEDEANEAPDVYLFVYEAHDEGDEVVESFTPIEDEATFEKVASFASQQLEVLAGA